MSLLGRVYQRLLSNPDTPESAALARRVAPGQAFGDLQLKQCRHGPLLFFGPIIGKSFELYGEYSESELALMRQFIAPGDTVIDIGSNLGDLTVPLARTVGPEGLVIACESHADVFNVLCANLALNALRNVRPVNAFVQCPREAGALAAQPGSPYLSERFTPPSVAIDDFGLARCSLIKVDVDGPEEDVLRSGEQLLRRARPVLYVENDLREKSPSLLRYMDSEGYDLYWHAAPVFSPDNFYRNTDCYWPGRLISTMVLGLPRESGLRMANLPPVHDFDQWWEFEADWVNDQLVPGFSAQVLRPGA